MLDCPIDYPITRLPDSPITRFSISSLERRGRSGSMPASEQVDQIDDCHHRSRRGQSAAELRPQCERTACPFGDPGVAENQQKVIRREEQPRARPETVDELQRQAVERYLVGRWADE